MSTVWNNPYGSYWIYQALPNGDFHRALTTSGTINGLYYILAYKTLSKSI